MSGLAINYFQVEDLHRAIKDQSWFFQFSHGTDDHDRDRARLNVLDTALKNVVWFISGPAEIRKPRASRLAWPPCDPERNLPCGAFGCPACDRSDDPVELD